MLLQKKTMSPRKLEEHVIITFGNPGNGSVKELAVLQSCFFNIFGINRR